MLKTFEQPDSIVIDLSFSPDRKALAVACSDGDIKLLNLKTATLAQAFPAHGGWVNTVSFSPNGKMIVSASHDKTIRLWPINDTKISLDLNEQLDDLLLSGCNWLRDYLKANPNASSRGFTGLST